MINGRPYRLIIRLGERRAVMGVMIGGVGDV